MSEADVGVGSMLTVFAIAICLFAAWAATDLGLIATMIFLCGSCLVMYMLAACANAVFGQPRGPRRN